MGIRHSVGHARTPRKIICMKTTPELPTVSKAEIERSMKKTETIQIRLTALEKEAIVRAKDALGLTTTEFLIKSSELVSAKLLGS